MSRFRAIMHTKAGRLLLVLSPLLLVALFFCLPGQAPAAHAASVSCGSLGSLIESDNFYSNGTKIGELDVYYNGSTGNNCAYTRSGGPTWGVSKSMLVQIQACAQTSPSPNCNAIAWDQDDGNYSYYAGPVGVHGQGHCIFASGEMNWNGHLYYTSTNGASHCR